MTTAIKVERRRMSMRRRKMAVERRQVMPVTLSRNSRTATLAVQMLELLVLSLGRGQISYKIA